MKISKIDSETLITLTFVDMLDLISLLLELRIYHRDFGSNSPDSADELLRALIYDLQQTLREIDGE